MITLGAVAYDPKVVTIWDGFRAWLARPAACYVRCDCEWAAHLAVHYRVEQDGS